MRHLLHTAHPEQTDLVFDLINLGEVSLPEGACRLGYQVDLVPSKSPSTLIFGIVQFDDVSQSIKGGFAVRIDLERGEIWDALNETGLVGWLNFEPSGLSQFTEEEPLLLSFEIESTGSAMIPKLRVGDDEWLYPALPSNAIQSMNAVAGTPEGSEHAQSVFLHPALWREQD